MSHINRIARKFVLAALLCSAGLVASPRPAAAYQIDCAILLCLAGGFPPSEPCARARAEIIRRITPWPIEPPLQLWRCPMRAEFWPTGSDGSLKLIDLRYLAHSQSLAFEPPSVTEPLPVLDSQIEDYLSAIKVYHLRYSRSYNSRSGNCNVFARLEVGSYDPDGTFSWARRRPLRETPVWLFETSYSRCSNVWFRGVGMEWRDYEGVKGTEVVKY
jgi:hypothetical protein